MSIRRRIEFLAYLALCASITIAGCSDRANSRIATTEATASSPHGTQSVIAEKGTFVDTADGPTINVDSSTSEPRIEFTNNTYIVRLPAGVAKVLFDSLPGFTPSQLKSYPTTATPPFTYLHGNVELPCVVVGDFNGDSKLDVALEGRSKQTSTTVMLLSNSSTTTDPQFLVLARNDAARTDGVGYLGLLHPQELKDPYVENVVATLHYDGIQRVVPYQSSTVYYLENGVVKHYVYQGD